jgi:hypothetical protein
MTTQTQPNYQIEPGTLANTYELFVPSSINTGAQISADRIDHITADELRRTSFYTANIALATKRDGKLLLGIGGNTAFNAVFRTNIKNMCKTLINDGYISLNPSQIDQIIMLEKAGEVVFINPNNMKLGGIQAEYRTFAIRTSNYDQDVTVARLPWISAGYGTGNMLEKVMHNLRTIGNISETTVYTLNPDHAAEHVKDESIVARACWLGSFNYYSDFYAIGRDVGSNYALRGVSSVIAEGDEKNSPLETLIGKGSVAHDNIAVVRQDDVSPQDWQLLTQKQ